LRAVLDGDCGVVSESSCLLISSDTSGELPSSGQFRSNGYGAVEQSKQCQVSTGPTSWLGTVDGAVGSNADRDREQAKCPRCVEPAGKRTFKLWAKFGLALVLAVGIAVIEGPGTLFEQDSASGSGNDARVEEQEVVS